MTNTIRQGVSLAPMTSWLVGGPAEFYVEPGDEGQLESALQFAFERKLAVTVLGGGTNVLISDQGVRGLVVGLKKFSSYRVVTVNGRIEIEAQAGMSKSELLKVFLKEKCEPALFLAGLPGDVGGGIVMNAGVSERIQPREFVEITKAIEVWRWPDPSQTSEPFALTRTRIDAADLQWSYRHCSGWQPGLIAKVWMHWPIVAGGAPQILERVREANRSRLQKQPLDMPSCGSVFVNPPGQSAGRLIEAAGLKGFAIGGARVSEKHANFIVNTGGATAHDLWCVIQHVRDRVAAETGVSLVTEVVRLGSGWDLS